ncbi:MAG: hypothetical protein A3F84_27475 [Candidatus Handelsmanbacteria bacterium RIFCSPLOWO2_12_FULL_64_10]|uniref:Transporter n=1 Tax=Handelsmanbacteria sp. (strain RIFCSPLOWO2_12_FULL_64_10) TaxID=1817868 RepID=A0A1F6D0L1_HANXR|nr:MAG: hypothetical protein A3F84_27475 [Candidatus Handelsmanbacteria bacterium RIFCSPLOWO2_12_FULL_64_10]
MRARPILIALLLTGAAEVCAQEAAPLTIQECLESARRYNKDLIKAQQRLREVGYEHWDVRSRFFPTVSLEGRYYKPGLTDLENNPNPDEAVLRARQRILEFGGDAREEVQFRDRRRQALYDYEGRIRQALSNVRRNFYLAVLKTQQIQSRQEVLRAVNEKLRGIRVKYARGVAKEFDLLTAQLDSLQQEGQIQALLGEQRRLKLTLLRLIGRPTETDVALSGQVEPFPMGLEEAVAMALREDVQARQLREEVGEKQREHREAGLAYLPDVTFQMGIQNGWGVTSLDLSKSPQGRTWLVDLSSRMWLSRTASIPQDTRFFDRDRNRFAAFQVSMPLFSGFQRYGQAGVARERLYQAQTALRDREDEAERRVRELHQTLRVQTVRMEIGAQQLQIARRRLEIQERLRDLGLVTDLQVENFRGQFFSEQDRFFQIQDAYIGALEDLRQAIGYFD